jgi:hypothetical protein
VRVVRRSIFALKGRDRIVQGNALVVTHKFYLADLHGVTLVLGAVLALKGRNRIAQGNALGFPEHPKH